MDKTTTTEHPPAIARMLRHFEFAHLAAPHLAAMSEQFHAAAHMLAARDSWIGNDVAQLANRLRSWPGPESEEAQRVLEELRANLLGEGLGLLLGAPEPTILRHMRSLLVAKDCAVRAVLELQRDLAPAPS